MMRYLLIIILIKSRLIMDQVEYKLICTVDRGEQG